MPRSGQLTEVALTPGGQVATPGGQDMWTVELRQSQSWSTHWDVTSGDKGHDHALLVRPEPDSPLNWSNILSLVWLSRRRVIILRRFPTSMLRPRHQWGQWDWGAVVAGRDTTQVGVLVTGGDSTLETLTHLITWPPGSLQPRVSTTLVTLRWVNK